MAKHKRLDPVYEIAESRQEEAARKLAHLMQYQAAIKQQINQLRTYREDYKRNQILDKSLHTTTLLDRQVFLGRLNESIAGLEDQLATVEKNLLARMEYWKATRARTRALDKVMTRFRLEERKRQERHQQKEQDEQAARLSYIPKNSS